MSLKILLPFNNTVKNFGFTKVNITSNPSITPSYVDGPVKRALSFNGSTFWKSDNITLDTEATIAYWSKTSTNAKMAWVLESDASSVLNLFESSIYTLNTGDSNNNPFKTSSNANISVLHDNVWHHFAITFGNSAAKLYIDGIYTGTAVTFRSPKTTNKPIKIGGGYSNGHSYDWNGAIADFRVYGTALSASEISKLYNHKAFLDIDFTGEIDKPTYPIWLQLLHHNAPANQLFTAANCKKNGSNNTEDLYSRCGWLFGNTIFKLDNDTYELLAKEKTETNDTEHTYRWTQTSSPTASTITGFKKIINTSNSSYLVGLKHTGSYSAFHNGATWYCACASYTAYQNGIPGFAGVDKSGYLNLWVRAEMRHIPNDYDELEWVKFSPGQYVKTGLQVASGNTVLTKAKMRYESGESTRDLMGWSSSSAEYWGVTTASTWEKISYTNSNVTVLNNLTYNKVTGFNGEYQIGALTSAYSTRTKYLYRFKIYINSELKRNMIPCIRKSDSKVGLFDVVTKKFYTHTGSGNLVAGPTKQFIPKEYEQVEYIQSNGTQYLGTGISSNGIGIKSEIKVQLTTTTTSEQAIIGRNSGGGYEVGFINGNRIFAYNYTNYSANYSINYNTATTYNIITEMKNNSIELNVNGVSTNYSGELNSPSAAELTLFRHNSNYYLSAKMYYARIWNNDLLVRNFIPVKRKSDGIFGLYDTVSNTFFTNAGTGSFTGA